MTVNSFFSALLPYISTVLAICISIGGLWAVHQSHSRQAIELSKQAGEIQERVIAAQKIENEGLERQVSECKQEITHLRDECRNEIEHLKGMLETTADLLQQKGFTLTVGDDTVTLEGEGKVSSIKRKVRPVQRPVVKKETP